MNVKPIYIILRYTLLSSYAQKWCCTVRKKIQAMSEHTTYSYGTKRNQGIAGQVNRATSRLKNPAKHILDLALFSQLVYRPRLQASLFGQSPIFPFGVLNLYKTETFSAGISWIPLLKPLAIPLQERGPSKRKA